MDAKSTDLSSSGEEDFKYPRVHYWQLMKYSSKLEIFLLIFGIIMSCLVGSSMPISFLLFSDLINEFISETGPQFTMLTTLIESFSILGAATFVVAFLQMFCLKLASKMQARRIKLLFYNMILRQDVAWFDEQNVGQLITRLTEGIDKIESGIGEKLGIFVQYILIFVSGIIVGFTKNWKLSLVACSIFPLVVISCGSLSIVVRKFSTRERAAYSKANGIAGEVLGAIRTIFAFEGQEKELKRYKAELGTAEKLGIIRSSVVGSVFGFTDFSIYILIAVTFWYGVEMLAMNESNPGDIILVVFAMLFGSATLGQSFQQFDHFNFAKEAASEIFYIIDRTPPIDKQAPGIVIDDMKGEIEFKNVSFQYPMRTDVTVLQHFNLKMKGGQTVAIVGPSGSGKSTVVQLIQRFYNCTEGSITIDGIDLKKLDLKWFRSRLGVVCQEPLLFAGTVAENIRLGKLDATQEEIEEAAKLAEAHDFISKLPEAYDTFIAESGGGMSGGQKQRIAIARALIRDPRILLLDEATSALDTRSEQAVQLALNKAKSGRTVIIVAHRLSTVRDADVIMVVDRGEIVESGTHDELMSINGIYRGLVKKSGTDESETAVAEETDEEEKEISESLRKASFSLKKKAFSETGSVASLGSSLSWKSDDFFITEAKISSSKEVMRLNKPEWIYLTIGALMAVVSGVVQSGFTLVYTEMYDIFSETDMSEMRSRAQFIAGLMTGLGFIRLLGMTLSGFCLGVAGERLTKRCRVLVFEAMLNQEIGWFDEPENQPGSLTGRLAADVPMLQNVSGKRLGSIIETLVLIICSLFIGFYFSWQITLVALAFFPVLMIAGAFQMQQWTGSGDQVNMKGAGLAHETLSAARTVFSLGAEEYFSQRYVNEALVDNKKILISALTFSSVSALANSLMNFEFAAAFYAGGKLMESGELTMLQVFRAYTAISFGAQNLGVAASYAPDTKKAGVAAKGLFQILRRTPLLQRNEGEFPSKEFQGNLTFDKVDFRYPTRRKIKVLKHFTYDVPLGKSVALVGQSGCGKSTVLQLVQRFYDVSHTRNSNCISIDGIDIRSLAPNWIRRQIGVVSQEPNLLDLSIRENIAYGMNFQEVSMGAIIDAAKQANAHNFILQLPAGYDTEVGPRGSQLSGGQKQRIAIARALLRNPRLLLLDEATAALDNESEGVVQEALDEAMKKGLRTTLVVAHRLTTVKKCDLIVVLENGRVIESGSPAELMSKKGAYYALNNADIHVEH